VLVAQRLNRVRVDYPSAFHVLGVRLISDDHDGELSAAKVAHVVEQLFSPGHDVLEAGGFVEREHYDPAVNVTVVNGAATVEAFLPRGVPYF